MIRILYILLMLLITNGVYSQDFGDIMSNASHYEKLYRYIENPNSCDTLCKNDLIKAKQDYENGNLTFCKPIGLLYGFFRFDNQIESICKSIGLRYKVLSESDALMDCQTQGCYGAYMDKLIRKKYGNDINQNIYLSADTLFVKTSIENQIFLSAFECDTAPRLLESKSTENAIILSISSSEVFLLSPNNSKPEATYIVKVDSLGRTISHSLLEASNMDYILPSYRIKLCNAAENKLDQLKWVPGQILNYNINCSTRVTVIFKN